MAIDPFLSMLGLARRAGKLAFGDELVRETCGNKKARCVFVAADAGVSTAKKASFYAGGANIPLITLPHGKEDLGAAIGKNGCAVCAVADIGLAAAALQKLAAAHGEFAAVAAALAEKNERIQSRRGKKKPKDRDITGLTLGKAPQAHCTEGKYRSFRSSNGAPHRTRNEARFAPHAGRRTDGTSRRTGGAVYPLRKSIEPSRARRALHSKAP
nr:ribosomal L7Ae/L30e/S12e/Gadd45 family protein [uncultured Agathobaculum sp.]